MWGFAIDPQPLINTDPEKAISDDSEVAFYFWWAETGLFLR
jgi:hypothetical protein